MKTPEPVVFIVDDDGSMREALSSLIGSAGFRVLSFSSALEFLEQPVPIRPCCLVLDQRLPQMSGLDLQRRLAADGRSIPVIFITAFADVRTAVDAMKGGAIEFLAKPVSANALLAAVRQAIELDRGSLAERAKLAGFQERWRLLTQREREVVSLIVSGKLNKQIAGELGVSENTIKAHRNHIMKKMQVANFAELIRLVERLG